jgi:hypothetical protein
VYQPRIEVQDRPIYFTQMGLVRNPTAAAAAEPGLEDPGMQPPIDPFKDQGKPEHE